MLNATSERLFHRWRRVAEAGLKKKFAIDFDDSGLSIDELREFASTFEDPHEFVDWLGNKHDLISRREFSRWR
jgi:hypothetical protein